MTWKSAYNVKFFKKQDTYNVITSLRKKKKLEGNIKM